MLGKIFSAVVCAVLLVSCGSEPPSEQRKAEAGATATGITPAEAAARFPQEDLPEGAPNPPVTGVCLKDVCEVNKAEFERRDWPKAWQGDYSAQRNVAYCRANGCDGAVETNRAEACAWRSIIIVAHVGTTHDGDTANLKMDCGELDDAGIAVAISTAENIYGRIYKKPMPKAGIPTR